jgi:hypothetical protein
MVGMTSPWPPPSPDFDAAPSMPPAPDVPGMTAPAPAPAYPWSAPAYQWPAAPMPWGATAGYSPPPRPDYGVRRDLPLAALIVVALALVGVACGVLWHAISPRPLVVEGPDGSFQLLADADKSYFGAEAAFLGVTAAAGLLAGLVVWQLGRRRGPAIAAALAMGSAAGGVAARLVGEARETNATLARACGVDAGYDAICEVYRGHLHLRIPGLMLTSAIVALAVFLALSLVVDRPKWEPLNWAPPDPQAHWQPQPPPQVPQGNQAWPPAGYPPP